MKNNLRRLNALMELFKDFEFFSGSINDYSSCQLMGKYRYDLIRFARKHKFFTITIDGETGFTYLERKNYRIVLS